MLRIRTLGGLSVQRAGKAPTGAATQPRRLAVLALVARAGEKGITREKLLALLWPDSDEEAGRRALSQSLYALRRDLGAEELMLGVQELRLNPDVATCDVLEFETALAERNHERAAELYAGPFLDGFRVPGAAELDRWVDEERRSLEQRHLDLLERLARRCVERGDPAGGARWWRRIADLDPLNARYAVELMRSLVAAGDSSGALKHARIYEALLAQELDVEPDRQVIELAKRIRTEASVTPAANAQPVAPPPPVTATAVAIAPEPAPPSAYEAPPAPPPSPEPAPPPRARSGIRVITAEMPNDTRRTADPPARWSRRRVALAVAALVLVVLSATAWFTGVGRGSGSSTTVLAVGPIVDYRGNGSRDADAISDMLATNLARVPGLQVLSSARLYEVLAQSSDTRQSSASVARAAAGAGATEMVEGGLHAVTGGRLVLDLRRVDLATGAVRSAYRVEGTDVYTLVTDATSELARSLDHPVERLDPADVSTKSLVAYRFYEEGLRGIARGDYRSAVRMLEAATAEDTAFALAAYYLLIARDQAAIPNPPNAWPRLLALSDRAPERERLLIRGTWALSSSMPELSAIADSLAERYPAEVDGPYLQGYARMQNADFAAAIPYMKQVMTRDSLGFQGQSPRCLACDALGQLIYAYTSLDSLPVAERLARDYVKRQPRSARAWVALAGVLIAGDKYDEAIEAHRTALSISPVNTYDRVFPAIVHLRAGRFEESDRLSRDVIRTGSALDVPEGRWLLMLSLRYQRRWREAIALGREAIAAIPAAERNGQGAQTLRSLVALTMLESGKPHEAAALWDSIVRVKPPDLIPGHRTARFFSFQYTMYAGALSAAGDRARLAVAADSARAWGKRSLNRRDEFLARHVNALVQVARGDTAGAIESFEQSMYSPTNGLTRTNRELGALYLATNRPRDAVRVLGAALRSPTLESGSLYVTRTDLHELIARAYDRLGVADSAVIHYERVVRALADSDPEARPALEAANARLAALRR